MKSIIEHLLNYTLECEGPFQFLSPTDEESAAEEALEKTLSDKQKQLFNAFLKLSFHRSCDGEKEIYFLGFQTGAKLAFEIMGADFSLSFPIDRQE